MKNVCSCAPAAAWLLAGVSLCGAAGSFPAAFQSALTNQPPEAEVAFVTLAEQQDDTPLGVARRDRAWFQAAAAAVRQSRFERASALADAIQDDALRTLARMELLAAQKQPEALMQLAGAAPIETWPDALIHRAAMCRAAAALSQGQAAAAEKDLILAGQYMLNPHHRARTRFMLAELYQKELKDGDRALQVYDELLEWAPMNWIYYNAAMAYARLAVANGRSAADALKHIDKISADLSALNPRFHALVLECAGDVHAALGAPEEALSRYRQVVAAQSAPGDLVKSVQAKIDALTREAK